MISFVAFTTIRELQPRWRVNNINRQVDSGCRESTLNPRSRQQNKTQEYSIILTIVSKLLLFIRGLTYYNEIFITES